MSEQTTRRKIPKQERRRIFAKTKGRCAYCGTDLHGEKWTVDHIVPLANGGTNDECNMFAACKSCNHRKGTSSLESFRKQVGQFLTVLERDSVTYRNAVRYGLVTPNPRKVITFYFEKLEYRDL